MEIRNNTIRYGIYTTLGIGILFFMMEIFSLQKLPELRLLNIFIVIGFSNQLAKRNLQLKSNLSYLEGLSSIFMTNFLATVTSVLGFCIYVGILNPDFLAKTSGGLLWPQNLSLGQAVASLFLEGMAGAAITAFVLMQYWKDVKASERIESEY